MRWQDLLYSLYADSRASRQTPTVHRISPCKYLAQLLQKPIPAMSRLKFLANTALPVNVTAGISVPSLFYAFSQRGVPGESS